MQICLASLFFSLQSFNLIPVIDKPTIVHNNSGTLNDNSFIIKLQGKITSGNTVSDYSDNFSQFCLIHFRKSIDNEKL